MSSSIHFICNNRNISATAHPGTTVLDYIRRELRMTGTKEGCREGDCGACTILVGEAASPGAPNLRYRAVNSCILPLGTVRGRHVVTIEGLNRHDSPSLNPIQKLFVEEGASQCGFCTPGFIVSLTSFFLNSRELTLEEALSAVTGNICRCTGYTAIQRAIALVVDTYGKKIQTDKNRTEQLIRIGIIPDYFADIPQRLEELHRHDEPEKETDGLRVHGGQNAVCDYLVAGGTDLYVQKPEELVDTSIRFLSSERDLQGIEQKDGEYILGACTPLDELKHSPQLLSLFPRMKEFLALIASPQIRGRATIGGNIVNASPIGDLSIFFLALEARLALAGAEESRSIPLKDFFLGYKKVDLHPHEIVQSIMFEQFTQNTFFHFEKVSRRTNLDIAAVNSACKMTVETVDGVTKIASLTISAGGVAPIPLLLKKTGNFLTGKPVSADSVREAARIAADEVQPISDIRGSALYKKLLLQKLIYSHFITLLPDDIEAEKLL